MPKRPAKYSKVKSVKAIARDRVGAPPAARTLEDKSRRAKLKHKKNPLLYNPE
jgi:hypothetical protein